MRSEMIRQRIARWWRPSRRNGETRKVEAVTRSALSDARPLLTVEEIFGVPAGDERMPLQYHHELAQPWRTKVNDVSRLERIESGFRYTIPDRGVTGVVEAVPDVEANAWRLTLWLLPQVVESAAAGDAFLALAVACVSEPPDAQTLMREPVEVMHQMVFDSLELSRRQDVRWVLGAMEEWAKKVRSDKDEVRQAGEE